VDEGKRRKRRKNKKQKENINENIVGKSAQVIQAETEEMFKELMTRQKNSKNNSQQKPKQEALDMSPEESAEAEQ
jgi:hypothetical protein